VAILLGCSIPLILRPAPGQLYQVVGECFVYGLNDANRLLGPLSSPWTVNSVQGEGGRSVFRFYNTVTEESTAEDPRLEPLTDWTRVDKEVDGDDPIHCDFFKHRTTNECVNYDPRLEPELLRERGVALTEFSLI